MVVVQVVEAAVGARMCLQVHGQVVAAVEGPATLRALVGPLARVDALVAEEVGAPAKGLAAEGAGLAGLRGARVRPLVQQQALALLEEALALAAVVHLVESRRAGALGEPADDGARHGHFARLQGGGPGLGSPGLLHVGTLVDDEVDLQPEALAAVGAGECLRPAPGLDAGHLPARPHLLPSEVPLLRAP